jgi:hypothetical protein
MDTAQLLRKIDDYARESDKEWSSAERINARILRKDYEDGEELEALRALRADAEWRAERAATYANAYKLRLHKMEQPR